MSKKSKSSILPDYAMMLTGNKRIKIFAGEFGSGKTELALNYAINLQESGVNTAIVDMDLVKPYFRTRESQQLLEEYGVFIATPEQRLAHSDLPIMPLGLTQVLYNSNYHVIIDVGGGESAIVLGQIHQQLADNGYEAFMVVNTCRPFTSTAKDIIDAIRRIENVARLKITGLISNTNLAQETSVHHIQEGLAIVKIVGAQLGLPVSWVIAPEWLADKLDVDIPLFLLKRYTRYPWME
ncbi:MAG TPA: hypothetical protein VGL27_02765 [Negativicutes bacterium]|jgi:hypothetical protein